MMFGAFVPSIKHKSLIICLFYVIMFLYSLICHYMCENRSRRTYSYALVYFLKSGVTRRRRTRGGREKECSSIGIPCGHANREEREGAAAMDPSRTVPVRIGGAKRAMQSRGEREKVYGLGCLMLIHPPHNKSRWEPLSFSSTSHSSIPTRPLLDQMQNNAWLKKAC
jgi:hypothetical protein